MNLDWHDDVTAIDSLQLFINPGVARPGFLWSMPPLIEVEDGDDGVDFVPPDPGATGFHSISFEAPKVSPIPWVFSLGTPMAKPVEPTPEEFVTPPAKARAVSPAQEISSLESSPGCYMSFVILYYIYNICLEN